MKALDLRVSIDWEWRTFDFIEYSPLHCHLCKIIHHQNLWLFAWDIFTSQNLIYGFVELLMKLSKKMMNFKKPCDKRVLFIPLDFLVKKDPSFNPKAIQLRILPKLLFESLNYPNLPLKNFSLGIINYLILGEKQFFLMKIQINSRNCLKSCFLFFNRNANNEQNLFDVCGKTFEHHEVKFSMNQL